MPRTCTCVRVYHSARGAVGFPEGFRVGFTVALALINIVQRLVVLVVITLRPKDVLACNTRGTPSPAQSVATMLRYSSSAMLHALDCTGPKTGVRARQARPGFGIGLPNRWRSKQTG